VDDDAQQVRAAREGLGDDVWLLVDAGTVWGEAIDKARQRLPSLQACRALWLEEPFVSGALASYRQLAQESHGLRLAGGEGCHDFYQAKNMIDYAGLGYIQIDAGRIGGITAAKQVADYARAKGVQFVNHTFTTHLALSASLQPYAGIEADELCEYPAEPSALARELTCPAMQPDSDGYVGVAEAPGLGVEPDLARLHGYLVDVEIRVGGRTVYRTPDWH
jgi:L-alanine-DL-glutamate epimerase-like enolase superfamily enzyme